MNTRCPNCGRENPADAEFCVYCGFSLQWGSEENRSAEEPAERAASIATPPGDTLQPSATIVPVDPPPAGSGWRVFGRRVSRPALIAAAIGASAVIAIVWVVAGHGGGDRDVVLQGGPAGESTITGTVVWTIVSVRPGPNSGAVINQLHKGDAIEVSCARIGARNYPVVRLSEPSAYAGDWVSHKAVSLEGTPENC